MYHGLKTATFVNELEMKWKRDTMREIKDARTDAAEKLKAHKEESRPHQKLEREAYDAKMKQGETMVANLDRNYESAEREYQQVMNITYQNRLKLDHVKSIMWKKLPKAYGSKN